MAKNGFKVFDSDTHVGPAMEVLERYIGQNEKSRLAGWDRFKNTNKRGISTYTKGARTYRRRLGLAQPDPNASTGYTAGFTGPSSTRKPNPTVDVDVSARIADMDFEGVDVNFMLPSGWFGTFTADEDVTLEMGMYRAYHRWMEDYCKPHPKRLGGVILVSPRDVKASIEEIRKWGKSQWAWGVLPYAPYGTPLDHPDLEPIWKEAEAHDLVVALHTFTVMPPYAPGGLDNWENLFLQRSAAHPWCGMRNMASLIGAGLMDRYPKLRIATLEAGHGWLPFWLARIDEHAKTIKSALPELKHLPSEYAMNGRYFQSIEVPEGEKLTNAVIDLVGEQVLMYASDYPHTESHFPETVGLVMDWTGTSEVRKRKLLWDNAVKCYSRAGLE
jgi:predicted TIM-barrel fold metal-dependent hydrolase